MNMPVKWLAAAAVLLGAPSAHATPYFGGVWLLEGKHETIHTVDGKLPPMTPVAAKAYRAHLAARRGGKVDFDTVSSCLPHGLPRVMFADYPIEILQEKDQLTFVHETQHMPRMVYLGEPLPLLHDLDQNYMGYSVGKWDGDTLVVQSAGFNDRTTVDRAGVPHSTEMQLKEHLRLLDGGERLEDVITVIDPKTFTRPWSTRITLKRQPGVRLAEYVCTNFNPEGRGQADSWANDQIPSAPEARGGGR